MWGVACAESSGEEVQVMGASEQKRRNEVVNTHWWIRGHYAIKRLIEREVRSGPRHGLQCFDIGCSGTCMTNFLEQFGCTWGIDISFDGLLYSKSRDNISQADASNILFKNSAFDLVALLDVAEHVGDDAKPFREVYRVCRKRAAVIVSVPAFRSLWGSLSTCLEY